MPDLKIIPAIDLKGGRCVRLKQGKASDETVYSDDPVATALRWQNEGAEWLHVVDLDGAFTGQPVHTEIITKIADALSIPVETGGGLRTESQMATLLSSGVSRVIIGTKACESPDELGQLAEKFGSQLAVGIDAREGNVQVRGWTETSGVSATELAERLEKHGVETIIYTDTATDGMLTGPNLEGIRAMCQTVDCNVIASGGISCSNDIARMVTLKLDNLVGVIVGKALYDGRASFADLTDAVKRTTGAENE